MADGQALERGPIGWPFGPAKRWRTEDFNSFKSCTGTPCFAMQAGYGSMAATTFSSRPISSS